MAQALAGHDLRLLEHLGAGLAIVDPGGLVVLWNDDAVRILGVPAADALGTPWVDCLTLIRGDDSGGATLPVEILQLGGWQGQINVRTRDGQEIRRRCVTRPDDHQSILLHRLGLTLPEYLPVTEEDTNDV